MRITVPRYPKKPRQSQTKRHARGYRRDEARERVEEGEGASESELTQGFGLRIEGERRSNSRFLLLL